MSSKTKLTPVGYRILNAIVFTTDYPGYRPNVRELPNGDGKVDDGKRYAHVATKYITDEYRKRHPGATLHLEKTLDDAHWLAMRVATALHVPKHLMPSREHSALRVLEYPAGAGSHEHTDFDLFTLSLYRDQPSCLVFHDGGPNVDLTHKPSLSVLREAEPHERYSRTGKWIDSCAVIVQCSCGSPPYAISRGNLSRVTSCGCWRKSSQFGAVASERNSKHRDTAGYSRAPEYEAWRQMRYRCQDPNHAAYGNYGGRGITVCAQWSSYETFLLDMGRRPTADHSLDRIDNDRGYEPGNCRWATRSQQQRNKRSEDYEPAEAQMAEPIRSEDDRLREARRLNAQCHLGELAEIVGLGKATKHSVKPSDRPQYSVVYFAMPEPTALLRGGVSVGEWLGERMSRSRTEAAE